MCFWRPVGVRAGEVGAPLEFTSGSSWAGKGRRGTAAAVERDPMAGSHRCSRSNCGGVRVFVEGVVIVRADPSPTH